VFWLPLGLLGVYMYSELLRLFSGLTGGVGEGSLDLKTYRRAGEAILAGEVPYRDFFIEYPPGSLPFFVPPALFSESKPAYITFFTSEMALVLVAALVLTALSARALGRPWPLPAVTFAAGAVLMYPVAVSRYDAVVAFTLAAAVTLAVRGRGRAWTIPLAWAFLGLGAAAKLIPALAAPPLALLSDRRDWKRTAALGAAAFSLVVAAFFVPAYLVGGKGFVDSFAYHADRGVQLESLISSALMKLGYVDKVRFEFGAIDVIGQGVRFWSRMSLFVTAALLIVTAGLLHREYAAGRLGPGQLPRFMAAFLLAFMLGSKVLSPQYVIWLLPLVPLCAGGLWGLGASGLFLATCWTTTRIFPYHYTELTGLDPSAVNLLVGRNLMLVVLWGLMLALPPESNTKPKPKETPLYNGGRES
jgi:hypothetical protein